MNYIIIQDIVFILLLIGLSIPLGSYIYKVMTGQKVFLSRLLAPMERGLYKVMGIQEEDEMSPKKYAFAAVSFSIVGLIFVFGIQRLQSILPLNPEHLGATSWDLALIQLQALFPIQTGRHTQVKQPYPT